MQRQLRDESTGNLIPVENHKTLIHRTLILINFLDYKNEFTIAPRRDEWFQDQLPRIKTSQFETFTMWRTEFIINLQINYLRNNYT